MTIEEAIEILETWLASSTRVFGQREYIDGWFDEDVAEAFRMVIKASQDKRVLTCDGCRHVGTYDTDFPCSQCIRREKDYYEQER